VRYVEHFAGRFEGARLSGDELAKVRGLFGTVEAG